MLRKWTLSAARSAGCQVDESAARARFEQSSQEPGELRKRVRVYRLPDAGMMTVVDRARCAIFRKRRFQEIDDLVRVEGAAILGEGDLRRYKLMQSSPAA